MSTDPNDRPKQKIVLTNAHLFEETVPSLTAKEKLVAQSMLVHFNTKKVAKALGISPATVRKYCTALRLKMHQDNTLGAIYKARRLGLLD